MYRVIRSSVYSLSDSIASRINPTFVSSYAVRRRLSTSAETEENETGDDQPRTKTVITAKFHEDFEEKLKSKEYRIKKHPGKRPSPCVRLPALHEMSAMKAISKYLTTPFRERVIKHERNFPLIQLPDEPEDLAARQKLVRRKTEALFPISSIMDQDERDVVMRRRQAKYEKEMAKRATTWRQIDYDEESATVYCASRFVPNYAALRWVFRDLTRLDPNFAPKTLFDFGSGLGTTMHVANEFWPFKINEHMNVDLSKPMIDLCDLILRNGDESRPQLYPGVYYREYLPLSSTIKYDLVVSAFTLLELPSRKSRIEAIEALWNKTQDVLVIIESGSRYGFNCVLEARNLILQGAGYDVNKSYYEMDPAAREMQPLDPYNLPPAYIEGPCPHHFACPRLFTGGPVLCNFPISYMPIEIGAGERKAKTDHFSYVILRKGKKTLQNKSTWPRINQPVVARRKFALCRMCCPDGSMKSVTFTAKKHKGFLYKMMRRSEWGDIVPLTVFERERNLHIWDLIKESQAAASDAADDIETDSDSERDEDNSRK